MTYVTVDIPAIPTTAYTANLTLIKGSDQPSKDGAKLQSRNGMKPGGEVGSVPHGPRSEKPSP